MPEELYPTVPFQLDHVIARQHGGATTRANLALSCLHCNSHKGPNIGGIDQKTGKLTRLYNPRHDEWNRHFRWRKALLVGKTAIGRVTIAVLNINDPDFVAVRESLVQEGRFLASE